MINQHPRVHLSLDYARKSPIIRRLFVAEIGPHELDGAPNAECKDLKDEIRAIRLENLVRCKAPAQFRFASSLPMTVGGKFAQKNA